MKLKNPAMEEIGVSTYVRNQSYQNWAIFKTETVGRTIWLPDTSQKALAAASSKPLFMLQLS